MKKFLIIGLGNPGYDNTIHNIGALVIQKHLITIQTTKKQNIYINNDIPNILYAFNVSTMNISGEAVRSIIKYNNITDLIVIYDDIRVDIGKYKVVFGGSNTGHNGIKSIISNYHNDFYRVRVGAGPKPSYMELSDFVLSKISLENQNKIIDLQYDIWMDIYKIINAKL